MMTEPSDSKPFVQARVLVVDDLEDARWVLSNLMRQAGFVAISAGSGEEALEAVRTQAPDREAGPKGLPTDRLRHRFSGRLARFADASEPSA